MSYKYHISVGLSIRCADYFPKNIRFPMKRKPVSIGGDGLLTVDKSKNEVISSERQRVEKS